MLVRISPEDVEIGMFIHAFEGSWFDHPFWRRNFRIETVDQLRRIRNSASAGLVINLARGRGPADDTQTIEAGVTPRPQHVADREPPPLRHISGQAATQRPTTAAAAPRLRSSYKSECRRAAQAINRSRDAVFEACETARMGRAVDVRRMVAPARAIGASIARDSRALINLVRLKQKDEYSYLHSVAVCALMINFARHLGFDAQEVEDLGVAGLLHDVGKVAIPDMILSKPGALSTAERRFVRGHPVAGHRLLASSPHTPEVALELTLRHHEKIDGTGYPDGLKGDALSLVARMGAICDVYDAVTSDRPYKDAWTPCEALTEMQSWCGHFDPALLERFADSLGIYAIGTLVRLSTGELAIVVGSGGETSEMVIARAFFDCETLTEIAPVDRLIAPSAEHPRIMGRDSPGFWRFPDWDALRMQVMAATSPRDDCRN